MVKFLILSQVAKHVAMSICSVTWELAFSTGGTAIDKFRSSLTPNTAKAFICEQHWLWSTKADLHEVPINRLQLEVMVEVLEKLQYLRLEASAAQSMPRRIPEH
ncbi:zinc finger BED domain-containing protein RICESLEEPER 2-like protein [Tanacetum coccineum]